jgi:hypothetical protein
MQERTQRQLNHINKVLRFNVEELDFREEKLEKAGEALSRKRDK